MMESDRLLIAVIASNIMSGTLNQQEIYADAEEIHRLAMKPDWTPCAEGMPDADDIYEMDNRKHYWCTVEQRHGDKQVGVYGATMEYVRYEGKTPFWIYYGSRENLANGEAVIAWKPLPDPYRADDTTGKAKED